MALMAMALCEHGLEGSRSLRGFDGVGFVPSLDCSFRVGVVDGLPPMILPISHRPGFAGQSQGSAWTIGQAVKCLSTIKVWSKLSRPGCLLYKHIACTRLKRLTLHLKNSITRSNPMLKSLYTG
jgi:hypothetical protein